MGEDHAAPAVQESTANMMEAFTKAFPSLLNAVNAGQVPAAQATLDANLATAPKLAELQAQLYKSFGPQMAEVANQIAAKQSMAQANSDLDILNGPGKDLAKSALEAQKIVDPEYYKLRENTGTNFDKLFGSIDLNGGLSPGETEAVNRAVAQGNQNRGIANNPSNTAVAQNAMQYGQAGFERKQAATNNLTNALNAATGALPALKSGTDVFQVATGKPSGNAADNKFVGVDQNAGSASTNLGGNLLGQVGGLTQQQNEINANRRDSLDRFNQSFSSVVGSL